MNDVVIKTETFTGYYDAEGKAINLGDTIEWYTPRDTKMSAVVEIEVQEDGSHKIVPLENPVEPSRIESFGGIDFVDTDDIMLKIYDLPIVKL